MPPIRRITVERNRLRFAAAHMATFRGACEPLHGHNYDIIVEAEGELTSDSWIFDFGELKRAAKVIADELDHKFMLQRHSRILEVTETESSWNVRFGDRDYVFPRQDVIALPIDNTTAERISEWVSGRLAAVLRELGATNIRKLSVGIEEMPGQTGWYTVEL
ncbi:MAG: 6-carboxytetrahydropterin synthase [Chloroflexi bacterium]|nr:6-carboxytetrahydropterin synthase [Chloroflexota bacterium]